MLKQLEPYVFSAMYFLMPIFLFICGGTIWLAYLGKTSNPPFTAFSNVVVLVVLFFLGCHARRIVPVPAKLLVLALWSCVGTMEVIAMVTYFEVHSGHWILLVITYGYAILVLIDAVTTETPSPGRPHVGANHLD